MSSSTIVGTGIELDAQGIRIDGRPQLLLCASLFYFRLPPEQWRARLDQVRASGYTCVDVYLPWNFHELTPGQWSFDGRRDVAAFLDLAHETGLYVIARPGPYICSEWDGGALPAWLGLDPDLRVRQNEPRYLAQVTAWFDQALPILARRQSPGGAVIMVQLENELDFFDCQDRAGYLAALRDQAISHGITVPLIACAGQGDIAGAGGDVAGLIAACNFYPNDDSPHIEAEVRRYAALLTGRGLPLLVTETNRRHRTLRRLLASGASLIAPYLQSSGWNFGYSPAAGNWGDPGSFMSHDYDFGGYVSPTGQERPEYAEAQVLSRVLGTLGPPLALATSTEPRVEVAADFPTSSSLSALDLRRRRPVDRRTESRGRARSCGRGWCVRGRRSGLVSPHAGRSAAGRNGADARFGRSGRGERHRPGVLLRRTGHCRAGADAGRDPGDGRQSRAKGCQRPQSRRTDAVGRCAPGVRTNQTAR